MSFQKRVRVSKDIVSEERNPMGANSHMNLHGGTTSSAIAVNVVGNQAGYREAANGAEDSLSERRRDTASHSWDIGI